jgi:CheY-like chemotaxis protein
MKEPTAERAEPSRRHESHEALPLVLVADDCIDIQIVYGLRFRHGGYRVAFAASGEDAIVLTRRLRPDAVVMDLDLNGKDGWTATRELRDDPETQRVPIVVVSGNALPEHERRAYECGCDLFLAKPCHPETLLGVVRSLIARAQALEPEAVENEAAPSSMDASQAGSSKAPPTQPEARSA